ncbi:sulfotransferase family protein [Patescibacteria group bacterium]|nr:sulfotransferase family protein [Patescibacteria group bacterium]
MILSYRHKFIFVKTQKTAGTSIETALSKFTGKNDIITPDDEIIRMRMGYPGSQNCGFEKLTNYKLKDWYRLMHRRLKKLNFYNHMPAWEIRKKAGTKTWNNYFTFCFERNPWDKVISYYYFKYRSKPKPTLSEFIRSKQLKNVSDWKRYTIGNQMAVDYVGKYENLTKDLEHIRKVICLPKNIKLVNLKGDIRKDNRHYRKVLSKKDQQIIKNAFFKEIKLFGYKF